MKLSFRWYGASDPISLEYIRQIPGMRSIVTAVYDVKPGEVWPEESLAALKAQKKKPRNALAEAKAFWARREAEAKAKAEAATQALWLTEKFGEGEGAYRDIPGLCKAASRAEIVAKNHSFTPGVYVGIPEAPPEDEAVFAQRMAEIHAELATLSAKAEGLMATILKNAETLREATARKGDGDANA